MGKIIVVIMISLLGPLVCCPQSGQAWRGKKCAVVLTYDDALEVHLDNAIPVLDSLNFKASFYLSVYYPGCRNRVADWKRAASKGHELGNHTLFHPCIGNMPGREWVKPEYDLSKYTVQRMVDEIRMTNAFLESVDGRKKRTFAYTCGDMKIGDSTFIGGLRTELVAARGVRSELNNIKGTDLYNIDCYVVNGHSAAEMIQWVKKAVESESLLVILFHGVGGGHPMDVSLEAHRDLLHYIKQHEKDTWVAPLVDVAEYIKSYRAGIK